MVQATLNVTMTVLEYMIKNENLCREFPFIGFAAQAWRKAIRPARRGCRRCGKRPGRRIRTKVFETVKASVAGLQSPQKERFKELLGVEKIILYFLVHGKQIKREI